MQFIFVYNVKPRGFWMRTVCEIGGRGHTKDQDLVGMIKLVNGNRLVGESYSSSGIREEIKGFLGRTGEIDHLLFVKRSCTANETPHFLYSVKKEHGTIDGIYNGVFGITPMIQGDALDYDALAAEVPLMTHMSEYAIRVTRLPRAPEVTQF